MKKKLMMVAVLLGALSLGACVDDNESASVTAVREAKAAQLNSIAAMNNAEAEATTLLAQSQAAINEAKARQEAALADKMEAEARIEELKAQMAEAAYDAELAARLAEAEAAKKQAEADLQTAQAEIERLAVVLQLQLAKLQKALLTAQEELRQKEDDIADQKLSDLQDLADTYATALAGYTGMGQDLAGEEAKMAALKADLVDWEIIKAADIAAEELKIQIYNKQIAAFKQYANYTEDIETLKLQYEDAKLAKEVAQDATTAAEKAYKAIDVDKLKEAGGVTELKAAVEENELYKMLDEASTGSYNRAGVEFGTYIPVPNDQYGYLELKWKGFNIISEDGKYSYPVTAQDSLYLKLEYKDVRQLRLVIDNTIAIYDIAGKKKAVTDCETAYNTAVKATATAKAAYEAAPTDETKRTAYEAALTDEQTAKTYLENAQATLTEFNGYVEELETAYKLVSDQSLGTALEAAIKAYNEAIVAAYTEKATAKFAWNEAGEAYQDKYIAFNTLNGVVNGTSEEDGDYVFISLWDLYNGVIDNRLFVDNSSLNWRWSNYDDMTVENVLQNTYLEYYIDNSSDLMGAISINEAIKALEEDIKDSEAEIEKLKDVTDQEQQIEIAQATIDGLNAKLSALKAKVTALKTRLDAALAEYDTEETPAA